MILLVHLLFGAAIGSIINNAPIAIILAFLGHYFLDLFPHIEYDIKSIDEKQWQKKLSAILNIGIDLCLGIILVLLFARNQSLIYICAFIALIPDGLTVLNKIIPNQILDRHDKFHEKIHYLKNKKISNLWRILSQIIVIIISIIIFQI